MKIKKWGIIDVGSNTVRLCVYRVSKKEEPQRIATAKVAVGLASYIAKDGALSSAGIKVGARAISKLLKMAYLMGCSKVYIFATAALRNCSNSSYVLKTIEKKVDHSIKVISGEEEARLSLKGALQSVNAKSGLFFDIGGGSTEIMELKKGKYVLGESIPMGSLTGWSEHIESILPTENEIESLTEGFDILLDATSVNIGKFSKVTGIGGSMRMALKVSQRINGYEKRNTIMLDDFETIMEFSQENPDELARILLQINPARVHTFIPGCIIAKEILAKSGCSYLTVAKTGVREGYLQTMIEKHL